MDMIMDLIESGDENSHETASIRLLIHGKEVGTIIGKKGETIKRLREETGANVHITDSSSPERIVTISGKLKNVYLAFHFICGKCHDFQIRNSGDGTGADDGSAVSVGLRLIVPAQKCGTIIGKGGSKIKQIREKSGANLQVSSDMLPDSTERTVTVSGSVDDVTCCTVLVHQAMKKSTYGGSGADNVEYVPKSMHNSGGGGNGGMFGGGGGGGGGMGGNMRGNAGPGNGVQMGGGGGGPPFMPGNFGGMMGREGFDHPMNCPPKMNPMAGMMGGMGGFGGGPPMGPGGALGNATSVVSALAALAGSQLRGPQHHRGGGGGGGDGGGDNGGGGRSASNTITQEVSVPNDIIGCIIGKGGSKIAEIRQMTGAMITISKFDDSHDDGQKQLRVVTMKGNPDQVTLAEYLISTSVEMHKANTGENQADSESEQNGDEEGGGAGSSGINPSAIPLANLLKNPTALNALSSLTNMNLSCLSGLQDMLAGRGGGGLGFMSGGGGGGNMGGRKSGGYGSRMRQVPGGSAPSEDVKPRVKFQPY